MPGHRIFGTPFASVYPHYIHKAERKTRTKEEVDQIICWLTGYDQAGLEKQIEKENDFETFLPKPRPFIPTPPLSKASSAVYASKRSKIR